MHNEGGDARRPVVEGVMVWRRQCLLEWDWHEEGVAVEVRVSDKPSQTFLRCSLNLLVYGLCLLRARSMLAVESGVWGGPLPLGVVCGFPAMRLFLGVEHGGLHLGDGGLLVVLIVPGDFLALKNIFYSISHDTC